MTASPRRVRAYRLTVGVLGIVLATAGFTLLSLVMGWFGLFDRDIHRIHDIGWGLLGGILLSTGLIAQFGRPERWIAPARQAIVAMVALTAGLILGGELRFIAVPIVMIGLVVALHPAREKLLVPMGYESVDRWMLWPVLVAAVPAILYALNQAEIQRACPPIDQHCEELHWAQMAALALALPAIGALAALRAPGWRLTAWCAGLAATLWGLAFILFPDHPSALTAGWPLGAGLVYIGLAEWGHRESRKA